ncbi:MAG: MarR family transcriptional regulator [Pseudomonadales bacterium]|mgnify:CR=1 FL=1|jgi:DNA-binding MarR family transcriptional regulator|nr:MarR family transcriptional regulator [Pseudomonadales bacterium]MDP6471252.1 MarR family transcriptional regulator [Pseudomonadales bacterium]MDP6825559.1 MarR family transcriptional regulator [Pseudomonadales bacterium]MDP6972926.1 MarR family transcriptional regulator [Pseudomonadales bacterium]|tara:strand:- start:254 stop:730 length:477 start_codon:yes stop_codon:yes gene_type:complete
MSRAAKPSSTRRPYLDPLESIGYLSRINYRIFAHALEKRTVKHGVTSGQWRFLRVLWEQDDITQRELSRRVGIKEATTVRTVASLVNSGFVTRARSKEDRRRIMIRLTAKARRLHNRLLPIVIEINERALQGVSKKDIETTRRVLRHTYENLTRTDAP